ncbi:oligosaccharide repeat unit polymerase [Leucobacter sp. wl10]|uniref:oligosaccharide repeat unit polymerase n=1 Tax=Leucobacter sp. wl10 TaxID=2304677 RepID=UPI000E5B5BD5|nr:oligosaccharide repeat unit polymerase [Leucobacter sp. wl10]RGE19786.1 oligosaccharide repeat unit polymerase [Leucobacter sp. wl10]
MTEYLITVAILFGIFLIGAGRRFGYLSAISLFVYAQSVMAIGIIPSLEMGNAADEVHAWLIIGTLTVVVLTATAYAMFLRSGRRDYAPDVDYVYPKTSTWALLLLSIAVCVLYYSAIGYIAFFESLQSIEGGGDEDIADLRIQSYSGSRYLFPGYVNQFKNSLLPALVMVIIIAAFRFRARGRHLLTIALVPMTLVFLLGTGQRAPFVRALIFITITFYLIAPKKMKKYAPRIVLAGLPLFFLTTVATGRAARELAEADGLFGTTQVLFEQLLFRIFGSSQLGSVVGFRWAYSQNIPAGSEWAQSILGLLPGQAGSDTANQIFALLYGSTRGTAPLSLWGSAYYNFGMGGSLLLAFFLGLLLCALSQKALMFKKMSVIQATGVAGVSMASGLWISDGPTTPLNAGLLAFAFLWIWGARVARNHEVRQAKLLNAQGHNSLGPITLSTNTKRQSHKRW